LSDSSSWYSARSWREPSISPLTRSISKLPIRARRCALSRCARLRVSSIRFAATSARDAWRWSSIESNARATSPISSRRALEMRVAKSPAPIRSAASWIARIGRTKPRVNSPEANSESASATAPASARFSREWRSAARSAARSAPTRSSRPGSAATTRANSPRVSGSPNASGAPHRSDQRSTCAASTASTATSRPSRPASERSSVVVMK
jgi:hypothetical protein